MKLLIGPIAYAEVLLQLDTMATAAPLCTGRQLARIIHSLHFPLPYLRMHSEDNCEFTDC